MPYPSQRHRARALASALAPALALAPLLVAVVPSAAAQPDAAPAAASQAGVRSYDIPAGPLGRVLGRFAAEAGLLLSADARLTEGMTSEGLRGKYGPQDALRRLLAGTGLHYRRGDDGSVVLVRGSRDDAGGPMELGAITVEGWRPSSGRGYRAEVISSATKTEAALVDVPVSVSVVTEKAIRDQNARSVGEALRNVAGVGQGPNPANVSVQEEFTIRGFESLLVRVNGVQRRSTGPLSIANIDSIEVLKGPFSVLYGDLSPGGFVNVQTKRPQREAAYEVTAGLSAVMDGGGNEGQGSLDATGPLTADGRLLYRFIAAAEGGSLFIDDGDREQYFVAPSFSYVAPDQGLRLDLDLSYLRNDETFLFGVPSRGDRPDRRIDYDDLLGSRDNDKETEDYSAELRARYALGPATRVDAALTYHLNEHISTALRPFGGPGQQVAADDTVRRSFSLRSFDTTDLQFEANVIHNVMWGDTDWRLLAGADVRRTEIEDAGPGRANLVNFDRVNVLAPDTDVALPSSDSGALTRFDRADQTTDVYGGYVQAEVWWRERLKLVAGARYSELEYTFKDASGFRFEEKPDSVDPRVGALYKLTPDTSLYASYSTSFEQSFSFDPDNSDPLEAEQWEAGIKQEYFGGRAMATLSVFEITQENLVTTVDGNPNLFRQIGEAETRGVEAEFQGELSEGLRLMASFAYLDNEITKDNGGDQGNRLPNVARREGSLWLDYDAYVRGKSTLTVGGGIFAEGARFTSTGNGVRMPGYATVDLSARYGFDYEGGRMNLQAGIKNAFDREYFVGGFGEGISFRGQPRTLYVQLSAGF